MTTLRIGLVFGMGSSMPELADQLVELENAGLQSVTVSEAYTFDAVSQLGYIAARTSTLEIATGILSIYARTPTTLAMTAAGLDFVSGGRFRLGIGASGPQVVEGFHGVPFDAPLGRTEETIDVCRQVWRRDRLVHNGRRYQIPLVGGTGEGKPLKLINKPVRSSIPITVAATGPKAVQQIARIADGWEPIFFHPGRADDVWGPSLRAGLAERSPELGPLEISVRVPVAVGDDTSAERAKARAQLALYIGGMGSRGNNFYNNLACRYGYEAESAEIQALYLAGQIAEATALVPDEFVDATTLIGTEAQVRERLGTFTRAGVTLLNIQPMSNDPERLLEAVRTLRSATALTVATDPGSGPL
jgi:F420-dependent oxidoreductase-like protein